MNELNIFKKIFICIIGGILDFALNLLFCYYLELPVFMDTIFVITVLFIFGFFPAIFTLSVFYILSAVFFTIKGSYSFYELYYFIAGVSFVGVSWFFLNDKERFSVSINKTVITLILSAILSATAASVVGGLLNFMYSKTLSEIYGSRSLFLIFFDHNYNFALSCILGRIPILLLDRFITTFLGFLAAKIFYKFISEKIK